MGVESKFGMVTRSHRFEGDKKNFVEFLGLRKSARRGSRRLPRRSGFLVLKVEGLDFLETWFGAQKPVPHHLTRIYQLLLHVVAMKGMIPVLVALRTGYTGRVIADAVKRGYVEVSFVPKKASEEVRARIREMIGKPPREMIV